MLFEPVIDLGFERPQAKLRALKTETIDGLESLIEILDRLDACIRRLVTLEAILDSAKTIIEEVCVDLSKLPKLEPTIVTDDISQELMDTYSRARDSENQLLTKDEQIHVQGQHLPIEARTLDMQIRLSIIQTAELAVLLERTADHITRGTREAFQSKETSEKIKDLAMDGVDKILESQELPAIGPVFKISKLVLAAQRRPEEYEELLNQRWSAAEYSVFLSAYFKW